MRVDALAETVRWLSLTERPGETWATLRCREAMFPGRGSGPCIVPGDGAFQRNHFQWGKGDEARSLRSADSEFGSTSLCDVTSSEC